MMKHVGKSARRMITFALVTMMMLGGLVSPASAQSQSIQSSLTGVTITYSAPYSLSPDGRYADDAMETMMFLGPADILAMGFMSPFIDLNQARDIFLESLFGEIGAASTIDRGDYSGVSYSLDMLNIDGFEMGVFSLFMNQRSHGFSEFYIFIAPPTLFASSMQAAQGAFTINGNQLMDGVDPNAMGDMVTANLGITGGEAVTDVTDVADPNSSETRTTDTTTTQTTPATDDQAARDAYLQELKTLYDDVEISFANNAKAFSDVSNEVITVEAGADIIFAELTYLSGTNDRISAIEVPASMQEFHNQEVVPWGNAVTSAGTTWFDALDGLATQDEAIDAINDGARVHADFGPTLQAEMEAAATTETTETTTTHPTPAETDPTPADAGDVDAYLTTIQDQRLDFILSLGIFNDHLNSLEGEPTDAQVQAAREGTLAEAERWTGFSATAQQLSPPAGYEGVHEAYLVWAADVTELGNLWIAGMNTDASQIDAFFDYIPTLQQSEQDLQAAIDAAGTQDAGTSETAETGDTGTTRTSRTSEPSDDEVEEGTESTQRTSRSTRASDPDDEEDTSGTSRTSRTSRSGEEETGDTSERPGRTQRTGQTTSDDSGNPSETRDDTTESDPLADLTNGHLAEGTGADVAWNDEFSLDDRSGEAITTDPDTVRLMLNTSSDNVVTFSVIVEENADSDATAFVTGLVNDEGALESTFADDAVIIDDVITDSQSAVLVQATDSIGDYYIYMQVTCVTPDCDTVSTLILVADDGATLMDSVTTIETGVAVNGTPVVGAISPLDLEDAINQSGS